MPNPAKKPDHFYCGTSNVELPVPNKTHFPEEYRDKSRLNYYASLFNTVEINSSFYRVPMGKTVEKWAADVPEQFRFSFKLWRGITHARDLQYDAADVGRFMAAVSRCGSRAGCVLVQFPASIKASQLPRLKKLMDELQAANTQAWRLAIEFRDKSWYNDTVYELLDGYNAAVVVHDIPASATPITDMETDLVYMRFHGEQGDYRGGYSHELLQEHAANIKSLLKQKKTVYAYFNNTIGDAVSNAMTLAEMTSPRPSPKEREM